MSIPRPRSRCARVVTRLALVALMGLSLSAHAREPGWYVGMDVGLSSIDLPDSFWIDSAGTTGEMDEIGLAYGLHFGYQLSPRLAIEAGYLNMGKATFTGDTDGIRTRWCSLPCISLPGQPNLSPQPGPISGDTDISGLRLQVVGAWPVLTPDLQFIAKGGMLFWDATTNYRANINAINSYHDDGGTPMGGIGLKWRVWRDWRLSAEWQYTQVRLEQRGNFGIQLLALGLTHPL